MKRKVNEGFDHFQQFGACRCDQQKWSTVHFIPTGECQPPTHHWLRHPVVQGCSEHARLPRLLGSDSAIGSRDVMMSRDNYRGDHCARICRLRTVPASLPSETRPLTPCSDTCSWTPRHPRDPRCRIPSSVTFLSRSRSQARCGTLLGGSRLDDTMSVELDSSAVAAVQRVHAVHSVLPHRAFKSQPFPLRTSLTSGKSPAPSVKKPLSHRSEKAASCSRAPRSSGRIDGRS